MAIIICPECGQQISDKAKKCVYCGKILIQEEKRVCAECGTELEEGVAECPNCGCPIENMEENNENEQPQKVEVTGVKVTKKVKKIIGIVVVFLIVGAVATFGVLQYQKKKTAEENARIAEENAKKVEEYAHNLKDATYTILTGSGLAESSGNLIKQVWYNAIYEKRDDKTDKYTRPKGYFVSSFNDALKNLFADTSFSSKIRDIKDNQKAVNEIMKKLKNPPDEYKEAYDSLSELYELYIAFTNCATDPSGSLTTYSNTFNEADTKTFNAYNVMKLYLDD